MALNTFNPPVAPSPSTNTKPAFKLLEASFGDGYTQVTRDGLNHIRRTVTLRWDALLVADATTIENFFLAQGGDTPFLYALSDDSTRQWRCTNCDRTRAWPNSVSATFVEDFSLVS